ncbi:MAG: PLP-dependent aspartate aminotransferase family protein [Thermoguttaceae bacterium]
MSDSQEKTTRKTAAGDPAAGDLAGYRWSTLSVHGGEDRQKARSALTDPIFLASTYSFADTQSLIDFIVQKQPREEYARYGNPTEKTVERKLAALEGAEEAVLYSSGMTAIAGLLLGRLRSGDELVLVDECYLRTRDFCLGELSRFGIKTRLVPPCDDKALEAAITPATRILLGELPTNPHLSVLDLARFAAIGKKHGVETVIDATLATPYNVRPLEFGVDYVLHSCTKYLGGHNDLLAGVVLAAREKIEPLRKFRGLLGLISAPHTEHSLLRGLKTFELRMERHNANGQGVAEFLAGHPRIERVYYPGLPGHPQHELARRVMRGFGGVVTFTVKDADWRQTADVVDRVRIPRIAASLGGVESLIEQPLVLSYYEYTPQQRRAWGIPDNMIRLSCGIENTEDLIADLVQALGTSGSGAPGLI